MILDEYEDNALPHSNLSKTATINNIINTIKEAAPHFKKAIDDPSIIKPINEDKYTQIFIEQLNYQIIKKGYGFLAASQYSELFHKVKGVPDLYFHNLEEGKTSTALFIVEAKILPAPPPNTREKEYVIGEKLNGGIERFKLKRHGYGHAECGILAYIKETDHSDWIIQINKWIHELTITKKSFWFEFEKLQNIQISNDLSYTTSIAYSDHATNMTLHHFWVDTDH